MPIRLTSVLLTLFGCLLVLGSPGVEAADLQGDDDGFLQRRARHIESDLKALTAKLAPTVICVQALADPDSLNPMRRNGGGNGSGVIIDPAGYALSNFHVTEYGPINVGMVDGRVHPAKVVAYDESADIVLIKIQEEGPFPFVPLGDSDKVRVGDLTIAMGNPFSLAVDFKPTTTLGVLSGTNRYLEGRGFGHELIYTGILQTDTPINPGNSGGPLFDRQGRLLGINGRIALGSSRKVNVGVGYAIPINMIRGFLPSMKAGVHADHGILGISIKDTETAEVSAVVAGSPADQAGLEVGDRIEVINGEVIGDAMNVVHAIQGRPAGETVTLQVKRPKDGEEPADVKLSAVLEPRSLPRRLARFAKGDKISNVDLITGADFLPSGGDDHGRLEQVIETFRKINRDVVQPGTTAMAVIIESRPDINEGRFNPMSRGFVTSERIEFVKGLDRYFSFKADHGAAVQGIEILGRSGDRGWLNGDQRRFASLTPSQLRPVVDETRRRACLAGAIEDTNWDCTLEPESVEFAGRPCHVLRTTWAARQTRRHFVDCSTGIHMGTEHLDNEGRLRTREVHTKHGRVGGKVIPLTTLAQTASGSLQKSRQVVKVVLDADLPDLLFDIQPSVHF